MRVRVAKPKPNQTPFENGMLKERGEVVLDQIGHQTPSSALLVQSQRLFISPAAAVDSSSKTVAAAVTRSGVTVSEPEGIPVKLHAGLWRERKPRTQQLDADWEEGG